MCPRPLPSFTPSLRAHARTHTTRTHDTHTHTQSHAHHVSRITQVVQGQGGVGVGMEGAWSDAKTMGPTTAPARGMEGAWSEAQQQAPHGGISAAADAAWQDAAKGQVRKQF
jgi:hypothetical protein